MSGLTVEYYWHCLTAEQFGPITTYGSDGSAYSVQWTKLSAEDARGARYGWVCDCPRFRFQGVPCKHVNRVRDRRCGWMQFGIKSGPVEVAGELVCPQCEGPVARPSCDV